MAPFGKREPHHAGSGIDKPEPVSLVRRWHSRVMKLLRPGQPEPTGNQTEQPPIKAKGRRSRQTYQRKPD